jgi:hypothetical protein
MTDKISFNETSDINNKVQIILRQTDYSEDEAREKLKANNFDHILVIKSFLGITEKKAPPIKSINQEIYKQLRQQLSSSIVSIDIQNNTKGNN